MFFVSAYYMNLENMDLQELQKDIKQHFKEK